MDKLFWEYQFDIIIWPDLLLRHLFSIAVQFSSIEAQEWLDQYSTDTF